MGPWSMAGCSEGFFALSFSMKTKEMIKSRNQTKGLEKEFNVTNPFDFMDMISLQGKTNFFEKRVGEYQKAGVLNNETQETKISFDADF